MLATVEELLGDRHEGGPAVLRAGGISVRDLKRTAVALDVAEPVAAFWVVRPADRAGLLASDGEADERYAATPAYDEWLERPAAERWATLASAWLAATRTAGRTAGRAAAPPPPGAASAAFTVLAAQRRRHRASSPSPPCPRAPPPPRTRSSPTSSGSVRCAGTGARPRICGPGSPGGRCPSRSCWKSPAGAPLSTQGRALLGLPSASVRETGTRAPSGPGDKLPAHKHHRPAVEAPLSETPRSPAEQAAAAAHAARLLAPLLPEPLDHVLLQADLTAVAPGPLERPLADTLGVLADVESKGGATVYRFTPGSVRRALDVGPVGLGPARVPRGPLPHARPAAARLSDRRRGPPARPSADRRPRRTSAVTDDALLSEILADKRSQGLRLRRLAPTVLAARPTRRPCWRACARWALRPPRSPPRAMC